MKPLLLGFGVFALTVLTHLAIRRLNPRGHYGNLFVVTGGSLVACLVAVVAVRLAGPQWRWLLPTTAAEYLSWAILYGALTMAYLATYPPIQADSPSMSLVLRIDQAGGQGLPRDDLETQFTDTELILPRLNDLVAGGLVREVDGRYVVAGKGAILAAGYLLYRRTLRMGKGG